MIKIKMRKAVTGIACIFSIIMLICKIVSQNVYGMEAEMIINKSNEVYYLSAEQLSVDSNNVVSEMKTQLMESRVFNNVASNSMYKSYKLKWEYRSEVINDLLVNIANDKVNAYYTYDENGYRQSKNVNGQTTFFNYTNLGYLSEEITEDYTIKYYYNTKCEISGFSYNNNFYTIEYSRDRIKNIYLDDTVVTSYTYYDSGNIEEIHNYTQENIGDINNILVKGKYRDRETGWDYSGRYYDSLDGVYIGGLSLEDVKEFIEKYGCNPEIMYHLDKIYKDNNEINIRTVQFPNASQTQIKNIMIVGKVIKGEAGAFVDDSIGVATVIKNRMKADGYGGTSAISVVSAKGQFYAYDTISDISLDVNSTSVRDQLILELAYELVMNKPLSKSINAVTSQLYFCSLKSAMYGNGSATPITENNGKMWKNGKQLSNLRSYFTGSTPLTRSTIENLYNQFGKGWAFSIYYNFK